MFRRFWGLACTFAAIVVPLPALAQQSAPAPKPEVLAALYQVLLESDGEKAFRAMRRLAALPDETISYLGATVPAAARTATAKQIEDLLRQLDSERFGERDKARQELERLDWQALAALRQAAKGGGGLELERRIDKLIARTEGPLAGANLRWHRTVEVVEWIGGAGAKALLERWAAGAPEARLTQEVNKALKRLKFRPKTVQVPANGWPKLDAFGDPLPTAVILRLGSTRWRIDQRGGANNPLLYTPDGKCLILFGSTSLNLVKARDGKVLARRDLVRNGDWVAEAARLTLDGKRLVASGHVHPGSFPGLRVWDLDRFKEINQWRVEGTLLGFGEKDNTVFLGMPKGIQQFDIEVGREIKFYPLPKASRDAREPILAFHGKTTVVASTKRDRLLVYDVSAPEKAKSLEMPDRFPDSFALSPDGKILACGSDWGILLYDLASGKPIRHVVAQGTRQNGVRHMTFSPDGKTLVFISSFNDSEFKYELVAWDMDQHKPRWKKNRETDVVWHSRRMADSSRQRAPSTVLNDGLFGRRPPEKKLPGARRRQLPRLTNLPSPGTEEDS